MLRFIDNLLNRITMYRLMLYYLIALLLAAAVFGGFGMMPYSSVAITFSSVLLLGVCWAVNRLFAWAFHTQTNVESFLITAFILALIITPVAAPTASLVDWHGIAFLIWAAVFAMASKYLLAIRKKHIFNPTAVAVALTALALNQYASWWVAGNLAMLAFVLVGGLLVARKLQRFDLVLAFTVTAIGTIILTSPSFDPLTTAEKAIIHTSLLFFAFVMLTEPMTTPPTRARRIGYGAFVGILFAPAAHIGSIYSTPELALVAGNVLSYLLSPKAKYLVTFKEKHEVGKDIDEFIFTLPSGTKVPKFQPGQYMEWTLGRPAKGPGSARGTDSRGNRRYFTLASSPTEPELRLGIKFYEQWSSFKEHLASLQPGDTIMCGQLAGDFTLLRDPRAKLAFVAGGIGVTPFRSMAKYLADRNERRSVTLLYSAASAAEFCFKEIFDEAERKFGMKTVYVEGRLDPTRIAKEIPDYLERTFYLSGPRSMVTAFEDALQRMRVPWRQIKTDFFPGFA